MLGSAKAYTLRLQKPAHNKVITNNTVHLYFWKERKRKSRKEVVGVFNKPQNFSDSRKGKRKAFVSSTFFASPLYVGPCSHNVFP